MPWQKIQGFGGKVCFKTQAYGSHMTREHLAVCMRLLSKSLR